MSSSPDAAFPIEVSGLSKTYRVGFLLNRRVQALRDLDLKVPRGSVFGLLGPNGAGKSTTIKILLNLVRPTAGSARVFGQPPGRREVMRDIGFVPENPAPYGYLSGEEFLQLSGRLAGLSGHDLDRRVEEVLGELELSGSARLQVRRYSKGMVQRLALAQGLLAHPKLLVLDEPTSGLDPIGRRQIRDVVLAQRERGATVLLCTHIIPDVEAVCDRIAIIVGGKRLREGSVRELLGAHGQEVELVVEGLSAEQLGVEGALKVTRLDGRTIFRVKEADTQVTLAKVLEKGGRVLQLTPVRFGIEDLFMSAVREAGRTVGSEVAS